MGKKHITLMLTITDKCNLKCIYCYEKRRENNVMDVNLAKEILSKYLDNDEYYEGVNIVLFGGEPFLYPERVMEICEWTWNNKWKVPYIFNFSTNGTVLTNDIKNWLRKNAERIVINLSADGTKETQNVNRSCSYDLIDYDFFVNTWEKPMVKMTISNDRISNLAEDVIFFHERGFGFLECNFAEGLAWNIKKEIIEKEFVKLMKYYEDHPHIEVCPLFEFDFNLLLQEKSLKKKCGIGDKMVMYYTDGTVYPCNYISPMNMEKEQIKKLESIDFNNNKLFIDRECITNCDYYSLCPTCYAANFMQSGNLWKRNRTLCEVLKSRIYYSALIKANRVLAMDKIEKLDEETRIYYQCEITAIKKILSQHECSL